MKYFSETFKKVSPWVSIALAIITIFFADYTNVIDKIIKIFMDGKELEAYKGIVNFSITLLICFVILSIFLFFNILMIKFFDSNTMSLRKYNYTEVLKEIKKVQELKSLTIFGYSISFAEILRTYFNDTVHNNLDVTLYVTEEEFIQLKLKDDHTIEARIAEINSRIRQWQELKNNNKIKSITINNVKSVPVENGLIINNEVIFISYYQWEKDGEKHKLLKRNPEDRGFLRLDKSNIEMFNYIKYQIGAK